MVWFLNNWGYSHSSSQTIWKLDHLKSDLQKVYISNVSGFQMCQISDLHGIQMPNIQIDFFLNFRSETFWTLIVWSRRLTLPGRASSPGLDPATKLWIQAFTSLMASRRPRLAWTGPCRARCSCCFNGQGLSVLTIIFRFVQLKLFLQVIEISPVQWAYDNWKRKIPDKFLPGFWMAA